MKQKIVHITSLHRRDDSRIFQKQLISLSQHFECYFIVADGFGDAVVKNVTIFDVGKPIGTKDRLTRIRKLITTKALALNADLYQYHDPELNLVALKLLKKGKKVIYDAHEDSPRQYTANSKGNKSNFKIFAVSKAIEFLENRTAKKLNGILTATELINFYNKIVIYEKPLPPKQLYKKMTSFNYALSINSPEAAFAFGTKIFDYFALELPIIHISNGGELYNLLKSNNQIVFDYNIKNAQNEINKMFTHQISAKQDWAKFDIENLTNQIINHFE